MSETNGPEWIPPYVQAFDQAVTLLQAVREQLPAVDQAVTLLLNDVREHLVYLSQFDNRD